MFKGVFSRIGRRGLSSEEARDGDDSGYGPVGRSPLVFLSFYLDLPLDAGVSEGHGSNEIEFSKPALED